MTGLSRRSNLGRQLDFELVDSGVVGLLGLCACLLQLLACFTSRMVPASHP